MTIPPVRDACLSEGEFATARMQDVERRSLPGWTSAILPELLLTVKNWRTHHYQLHYRDAELLHPKAEKDTISA
jgi:hypothetical protein